MDETGERVPPPPLFLTSAMPPLTENQSTAGHPVEGVLQEYWGYDSFLELQREAIDSVLAGQDSLVVLPTGGGKSLCYQAPALLMPGVALVVSPLISLMKDQVDSLIAAGAAAACINSTMTMAERRDVAERLRRGDLKLLYAAPERLLMSGTLEFLKQINVSFIAIDEAHCVSTWGHDFRPEYTSLSRLKQALPGVAVHAYTATATHRVRQDIVRGLGLRNERMLVGSFDRPNLLFRVRRAQSRFHQVMQVIERNEGQSGIVYCLSRAEVERTSEALKQVGIKAAPYHAGMGDIARHRNQEAFINDRIQVMVATVAFGMGIDKPDVRFVVHAGMPKSLEAYVQESGRAGRDGLASECLLLYSGRDPIMWRKMIDEGELDAQPGALHALAAMEQYVHSTICRHRSIVECFDQEFTRENCGACDICLGEFQELEESLIAAQKILSCVARLQQRFGAAHTAKVLTGSKDQALLRYGHDQLSTYGLMRREGNALVREWIDQLVALGHLKKAEEMSTLSITPSGWQVMRGELTPRLLMTAGTKETTDARAASRDPWEGVDQGLFEHLRSLRGQAAHERGVPHYLIFGDAALQDMARRRPTTLEHFAQVKGVGQQKLRDFGPEYTEAIRRYVAEHGIEANVDASPTRPTSAPPPSGPAMPPPASFAAFPHFREGLSIAEIETVLSRSRQTVMKYLADFIAHHQVIDPSPWVEPAIARRIEEAIEATGKGYLKPIYEQLGGEVSYDDIRVVLACLENRNL